MLLTDNGQWTPSSWCSRKQHTQQQELLEAASESKGHVMQAVFCPRLPAKATNNNQATYSTAAAR